MSRLLLHTLCMHMYIHEITALQFQLQALENKLHVWTFGRGHRLPRKLSIAKAPLVPYWGET